MHKITHKGHAHEATEARRALEEVKLCETFPSYQAFLDRFVSVPPVTRPVDASAAPGVTDTPTPPPAAVPYALQHRTSVPLAMLDTTPDGYYAVRLDDNDSYRFFRIKRPQQRKGVRTKWVGCIHVQSQHSEDLKSLLLYAPLEGRPDKPAEWLWVLRPDWEKYIILAMVDPMGAGHRYASEIGSCCICGKTLTDERSRHYGIGPECEKSHGDIIEYVDGLDAEDDDQ